MAADHAERGTGGIEQNAIERHSVPPRPRQRRIGADDPGVQPSALQIFTHPHQTLGIDVDGDQFGELRLALGDERSLAAGRRAGIEHPLPRRESERKGDALGAEILHGNDAFGKTRQLVHVARRIQCQRVRHARLEPCTDARLAKSFHVLGRRRSPAVHAQPHRRLAFARRQQLRPAHRPIGAQQVRQPHRRGVT